MVDINEVVNIEGKKLIMVTIGDVNTFYIFYPDGKIKEINKIKPIGRADKDMFISKLIEIMK